MTTSAVRERPIIMSAESVAATLAGTKRPCFGVLTGKTAPRVLYCTDNMMTPRRCANTPRHGRNTWEVSDVPKHTIPSARPRKVYPAPGSDPNDPTHLWRRLKVSIAIDPHTGCWLWQRHCNNKGYAKLTVNGRGVYAHRLAYELTHGAIPDGLNVLHNCPGGDNPACINPDHLFLGTQQDNMQDCSRKGRSRTPNVAFFGERNPAAKLTDGQVDEIRSLLEQGRTQREIAAHFGISQSNVSQIKCGRRRSR